jgi:hypothetical protein
VARVEESHKGHTIVIEDQAAQEEPLLSIDGQPVKVIRRPDGTYSSEGVFYNKYDSLLELARANIDIQLPAE